MYSNPVICNIRYLVSLIGISFRDAHVDVNDIMSHSCGHSTTLRTLNTLLMPLTAAEFLERLKHEYTSPHFQKALNGEAYKSLEDTEMVKVNKHHINIHSLTQILPGKEES